MSDDSYVGFAEVYDELMDDVPYGEWAEFLTAVLREYGVGDSSARGADQTKGQREGGGSFAQMPGQDDKKERDEAERGMGRESGRGVEADETFSENLARERDTVLDLGCGTGTLTELLACAGFDMIGVDNSEEMLGIALRKREESGSDILYLCQDMREFELYGTVGAVCSVCDSLNYILEDEDMVKVFSLVDNYLYPGGIFVFDFNTVYKYEQVIGDATIAENREDCSFIWENFYDAKSRINEYDLTIFVREPSGEFPGQPTGAKAPGGVLASAENSGGLFRRFAETHYQRGYTLEEMKGFLEKAGLLFVKAFDGETHDEVRPDSERVYVIAREVKKQPVRENGRSLRVKREV